MDARPLRCVAAAAAAEAGHSPQPPAHTPPPLLLLKLCCLLTLQDRAGPGRGHADHGAAARVHGALQGAEGALSTLCALSALMWLLLLPAVPAPAPRRRPQTSQTGAPPPLLPAAPSAQTAAATPSSAGGVHQGGPPVGARSQPVLQRRQLAGPQVGSSGSLGSSADGHCRLAWFGWLTSPAAHRTPSARVELAALPPFRPPTPCPRPRSTGVMDRALMHADCVYRIPAVRARGHICRTNQASHTAFRGYGGPQASWAAAGLAAGWLAVCPCVCGRRTSWCPAVALTQRWLHIARCRPAAAAGHGGGGADCGPSGPRGGAHHGGGQGAQHVPGAVWVERLSVLLSPRCCCRWCHGLLLPIGLPLTTFFLTIPRSPSIPSRPFSTPTTPPTKQEGDVAHFGQRLDGCQAQRCWDDVMASSDYAARAAAVAAYNKGTLWLRWLLELVLAAACRLEAMLAACLPHEAARRRALHPLPPPPPLPVPARRAPLPQARPGGDAHQVRHLLHNQVSEPGGRPGARVHR